jgi:hypothetical protein
MPLSLGSNMSNIFESMNSTTDDKALAALEKAVDSAKQDVNAANAASDQVTANAVLQVQDALNDLVDATASATTSTDETVTALTNPPSQPTASEPAPVSVSASEPAPVSAPAPATTSTDENVPAPTNQPSPPSSAPVSDDLLGSVPENNPVFHQDVHNMDNEVLNVNNVVPSVNNTDTVGQEQLSDILSTVRDTNNHVEQIHTTVNNLSNTVNDVLTNEGLLPNNNVDNFDNTEIEGFTNEIVEGFSRFKMSSVLLAISLLVLMVLGYLYVSNNVFSSDSSIELTDTPFMDMDFD